MLGAQHRTDLIQQFGLAGAAVRGNACAMRKRGLLPEKSRRNLKGSSAVLDEIFVFFYELSPNYMLGVLAFSQNPKP